jgi:hypothetical protein
VTTEIVLLASVSHFLGEESAGLKPEELQPRWTWGVPVQPEGWHPRSLFLVLGFELKVYTLSHSTSLLYVGFFRDRVSRTVCPGWL